MSDNSTAGMRDDQWWDENRKQAAGLPVDEVPMDVGPWAREKLECLRKYLSAYTKILRRKEWCKGYFYVDAFAGPGMLKVRRKLSLVDPQQITLLDTDHVAREVEYGQYIAGSPRVALSIEHPFTDYVFIEKDEGYIRQLNALKQEFGASASIDVVNQDCNEYLRQFLREFKGKWHQWHGFVFLDPYGMQVPWHTIASLGETKAIEVIVNFPIGMAIQRLLPKIGRFTDGAVAKLDRYFGSHEWYDMFYRGQVALYGENGVLKARAADLLINWYLQRLKGKFDYVNLARRVRTRSGRLLYCLIFAGTNDIGARIANDVRKVR